MSFLGLLRILYDQTNMKSQDQKKCKKFGIQNNISQYFPLQNKDEKPFKGIYV